MKPLPEPLYNTYVYGNKKQLALVAWRLMKQFNDGNLSLSQYEPQSSVQAVVATAILEVPIIRRSLKFFIAETDDAGDPKYYGYVGNDYDLRDAPWYIQQISGSSYRYYFAGGDFDKFWTIRASLPYDHAFKFKGFHDRYEIL